MGTDIHPRFEAKIGGEWVAFEPSYVCSWCDGSGISRQGDACYGCKGTRIEHGYDARCYNAFAVLANVRNGRGFAGVELGAEFPFIGENRGVPDGSGFVDADGWFHSITWVSLRELNEYDWSAHHRQCGVVYEEQFRVYLEKGKPDSYAGSIGGHKIEQVTEATMREIVSGQKARRDGTEYVCAVDWYETRGACCDILYSRLIPAMNEYASANGIAPDDIRIVMGFDS